MPLHLLLPGARQRTSAVQRGRTGGAQAEDTRRECIKHLVMSPQECMYRLATLCHSQLHGGDFPPVNVADRSALATEPDIGSAGNGHQIDGDDTGPSRPALTAGVVPRDRSWPSGHIGKRIAAAQADRLLGQRSRVLALQSCMGRQHAF